eukprot:6093523-Alexandrium_andersonii.AAC.1
MAWTAVLLNFRVFHSDLRGIPSSMNRGSPELPSGSFSCAACFRAPLVDLRGTRQYGSYSRVQWHCPELSR